MRCDTSRAGDERNRVRSESAREAASIDERIAAAWSRHPRRFFIDSAQEFTIKAGRALELIGAEVPALDAREQRTIEPRV